MRGVTHRRRTAPRTGRAAWAAWGTPATLSVLGMMVAVAPTRVGASTPPQPQMSLAPAPGLGSTAEGQAVERDLDEWRFGAGRKALAALAKSEPQSPEVAYLQGYQAFLEGDYAAAVEHLGAAAQAAPAEPNVRELRILSQAARDAVKDHKEARSKHFWVRYPAEDEVLVPYAMDTLESAYTALSDDLGFEAELPIRIEFYRSPTDLAAVSSLSVEEVARTGTIALCKWARLMVTTPRALSYGYPWLDSINHELVHYAVSTLTRDRAPVWLQEGLAKFLERRWREPINGHLAPPMEHLLAKALRSGKLIGFDAMHPSMAKLPSAEDASLAFAEVATAIGYLHAQGGTSAMRTAITAVAMGDDARQAVAAAAGGSWAEFERGWKAYMAGLRLHTFPGFDLPTTHIRRAGAIASRRRPSEDEALASMKIPAPLRHLRLGNMLLRRNRARAAVLEFEKGAHAVTAGGATGADGAAAQWMFPVKLGRTYLALGDPERALKAVAPAQTNYPDLPWPNLIAGEAQLARGDASAAIGLLKQSLATNPFDPAVHCGLASAYAKLPVGERPSAAVLSREQQFCRELAE